METGNAFKSHLRHHPQNGIPIDSADNLDRRALDLVSSLGKPVSVRDLVRGLSLDPAARRELKPVLRRLIADGALVKIRGARVGLPDRMNLVVGRLSCNPSGYGFVVPEVRREGQGDLFVAAANIREALHGDRVVARLERQGPKGPEGRIIRVLERANQRIVGRYEDDGRFGGHVVPFDKRVLHEVFVPAGEESGATAGQMVAVEITRPPTATRNPAGRVLEVLGRLTDPGVDLKVIVAKYGLPDAFPPEVEEEARRVARPVGAEETRGGRTSGAGSPSPSTPRPRGTTTTRSGSSAGRTAATASRSTSPTSPTTCARGARSTRRPTSGGRPSTSPTGWCRCCPTRSRATCAASSRAGTA